MPSKRADVRPPSAPGGTVLVTGGAGFIGGRLVERLLTDTSWHVVDLDLLTYAGARPPEHPRHTFVQGDIADRNLVTELVRRHQPRAIVHVAAETHVDRSIDGPLAFARTNVLGTVELLTVALGYWRGLDATARGRFRFLSVSTDEVYGSLDEGAASELSAYAPNSPYAASKAAADHFVRAFHQTYGLPVLTTHGTNTYGPSQHPEKLVPLMILNALEGRPLPVYGDGANVREWLHVDDHVRALQCVLAEGAPGAAYNVGGGAERTNVAVVHAICDIVDRLIPAKAPSRRRVRFVPDRPGHDRRYAVDSTELRKLGWAPGIPFEVGLERTVRWYRDNPAWVEAFAGAHHQRLGTGGAVG